MKSIDCGGFLVKEEKKERWKEREKTKVGMREDGGERMGGMNDLKEPTINLTMTEKC